ncbi:abortive infection system antitoxin AbiGi family protein [Marinomonas sp. BSi20584]|uniref:abortive infection system antitoxin AbiGi family protein n=1 Tax=Marinomonas sp. BSi20584 TaxID=1594462 RepID=UPI000C1F50EE|nr:abortive infection system antitoxin AbiGi family protein [Marinomonas sp. BSi20584]PJE54122.1 hypothetical protein TY87_16985 [Marinomonas sp. BSi20584]
MKSRGYISNELVHWTGRNQSADSAFSALKAICEEKILRLTYCPNYVNSEYNPKSAMVCFTDIPLNKGKEHCSKFGKFGVGFNKKKMIGYGANPVFYTTGVHFKRIKQISNLLARMENLEKDREWKEPCEPYDFTEDETAAFQEVTDFLQEYSYKNQDDLDYVTYYQREWRITFRSLPYAGDKEHEIGMSCHYIKNHNTYSIFKFDEGDIEYLIVPIRYWWRTRKLAKQLNCVLKIYEFSVRNCIKYAL